MKFRAAFLMLAFLFPQIVSWLTAADTARDRAWSTLNHVTHKRGYTFVTRRGDCIHGDIMAMSDRAVTLKIWRVRRHEKPRFGKYGTVTLERANILKVLDGDEPVDVVYSARSSWADVRALEKIGEDEAVEVVTRRGKRYKAPRVTVGDDAVTLRTWNKPVEIPKAEIANLYYVREAPISASAEYNAQEALFIDPHLWPYLLHIPPKIRVLLFDASLAEDNTPCGCPERLWPEGGIGD